MRAATVYIHPNGHSEKHGEVWKEHRKDAPDQPFSFKELRRDKDYIYLYDQSRKKDSGRPM